MRASHRRHPAQGVSKGVSFAELAIALLLLGVMVMPVFMMFRQGTSGTLLTRDEILAHGYAAELVNAAKGLGFHHDLLEPGSRAVPVVPLPDAKPISERFSRTLTVTEQVDSTTIIPYRYRVLVAVVAWGDGGPARTVRLPGLVFAGGDR